MRVFAVFEDSNRGGRRSRRYNDLASAVVFLSEGMANGSLFPIEIVDAQGHAVVTTGWLLDHWARVVDRQINVSALVGSWEGAGKVLAAGQDARQC